MEILYGILYGNPTNMESSKESYMEIFYGIIQGVLYGNP